MEPTLHLADLRRARGWGLEELSLVAGITPSVLQRVEQGEAHLSPENRVRIVRLFGLTRRAAMSVVELAPNGTVMA